MEVPLLERKTSNNKGLMNSWLEEVHDSLRRESICHGKEVIYPVPLCLKKDETKLFYHPKEFCFGPQHFRAEAPLYKYGEEIKAEVVRKFNGLLPEGLISVVAKFKEQTMQERIVKSYAIQDRSLITNNEVISWLLVRDACFVIEVLERFSVEKTLKNDKKEKLLWEHILNRENHHPLLNDIVKDMFKLENQLPVWVLEEIMVSLGRPKEGNWFEPALKNLSPVEVKQRPRSPTYSKKIHILQLLGEYMLDNRADQSNSTSSQEEGTQHNPKDEESGPHDSKAIQEDGNHHNQEDVESESYDNYIIDGLVIMFYVFLFLIFLPVLILWLLWLVICFMWGKSEKNERHVPTVEELDKIGVNFKALKSKGISRIEFKSKSCTLYLPKFTVDDKSEVILRNLLVMETHWEDTEKVMTRYVVLMNDLINTSLDVARLRTEGIIVNKLGSDDDVARMWNSVTIPATDIPKYDQIDTACTKINAYRRQWWRVLWAQFWRLHCSKPWLVASLLGGISLLLLTTVQVFCLFYNCQAP